jgi:hypothetical protein
MIGAKAGLVCLAALGTAACATDTTGQSANPRVIAEGRSIYVVNVTTEQEGRALAVSPCRERGGTAVFAGMIQYRYHHHHSVAPAAQFDCTN